MALNEQQLLAAKELLSRQKAKESLHEFAKQAWRQIEGDRPFIDGWHIQTICEHLEAVTRFDIPNLLINLPPRCMKSSLISVLWPAWGWIINPQKQFLFASYALQLSIRDSVKCRRLIESAWYQSRWGDIFRLVGDQNTKMRFENDKSGHRIASSVGGSSTGEGGDILICLPYDIKVSTNIGELKIGKIVEERIECHILTYNHNEKLTEYKPILEYEKNPGKKILIIELDDRIVECTEDHPIYIEGKGYIQAKDIKEGDIVLCLIKNNIKGKIVKSIKIKESYPTNVYNLNIADNHNYFANGVLVHNCDDPNNAKDGESEVTRESTNDWWNQVWSTRLNDPKTGCRVVVQQRLHEKDISGHIMAGDIDRNWVRLILPMEYEGARRTKTIILPSTKGKIWEDPRKVEGELLWPNRIGPKELQQLKTDLGSEYSISGQLQQTPSPSAGGIIKKDYFKIWKYRRPPQLEHIIQSWDTALEAKDTNCYSACTTWGIFLDQNNIMNIILLSLWRGKVEYPDLRKMAQRLYRDYRDDNFNSPIVADGHHTPDVVLVEAKVSGISLVQDLIRAGISAIRFDPNRFGDKILRVRSITHLIEAGRVWMPAMPPDFTKLRGFADLMVNHCAMFPNAESRDLVDTMSQVLLRLNASGWLNNSNTEDRGDTSVKLKNQGFY